ncbi:lytic transglycosylase domain-containing protein [Kordiimonas sp. SCSIO 12610]|uniref:lytic murein transglycosylase n=1 Tax=Kordiimonas sp. SCSIO 12610 TaxID=2829597 RepID=UPI00210B82AF|nr:lytic murein transglycosylase [Kordiimonas sp. SCSIO 12610]UTW53935.1 lytic murein transglycosylase [Kordiimonas sp. SCSIO 12610]
MNINKSIAVILCSVFSISSLSNPILSFQTIASTDGVDAVVQQNNTDEPTLSEEEIAFQNWLTEFRAEALAKGISQETIDTALQGVKAPEKKIVKRDRSQPEVVQTYANYLSRRVSDWRKTKGRAMMTNHAASLKGASEAFGVQSRFIAAIWGIETNYGTVPLTIPVFNSLATLAYDKRRGPRFRREMFAALEIMEKGYADYDLMKGSWAGAMGQPQFMPENYLKYAVDQDGNGKRDIWTTNPDVFGSIGNYLKYYGWRDDQTWGRPVTIPTGSETALQGKQADGITPARFCKAYKTMGIWRDLQDWQALGVRRADGSDLPKVSIPAAIIIADKGDNQAYLVYQNFCSIMRYNPSFKYALSVGLLSDTIR